MSEEQSKRRWWVLFAPLIVFALLLVFLLKGLGSDPTKLESVLIDKSVPEFNAVDLFNNDKVYSQEVLKDGPMLMNVWATWCPTCQAR